ncbi:MAG: hypothetical protein IMZ64_10685 [Bacteroidetes bacterium]|nr:hypothetical protein [Bacteroidota bacterium]
MKNNGLYFSEVQPGSQWDMENKKIILAGLLNGDSYTTKELARMLNVDPSSIYNWKKKIVIKQKFCPLIKSNCKKSICSFWGNICK